MANTNNALDEPTANAAINFLIGSTGNPPVSGTFTAGTNILVQNIGVLSIEQTLPMIQTWQNISSTSTTPASAGRAYVSTSATAFTLTTPASPVVGNTYAIIKNASGSTWKISVISGQTFIIGGQVVTGPFTLQSNSNYDAIQFVCIATNTWSTQQMVGNITYA